MATRPPRWTFYDLVTLETYTFEVNPLNVPLPPLKKSFAYQALAAPDGGLVAFENQDPVIQLSFSGTILSEAQYEAMITWFSKPHTVVLTDDLGLVSTIFISGFTPTRQWTAGFPWRHEYQVDAFYIKAGA